MAKRRTKKQKIAAKRRLRKSLESAKQKHPKVKAVKRQFPGTKKSVSSTTTHAKKAKYSTKDGDLASINKDLIKSVGLAALILALELMLYLSWR
jgi:hypothetical protein